MNCHLKAIKCTRIIDGTSLFCQQLEKSICGLMDDINGPGYPLILISSGKIIIIKKYCETGNCRVYTGHFHYGLSGEHSKLTLSPLCI
jgi:hypothetical protein